MDRADIPAWLETTRATAKTQMERWQGVDPSRLLEACDLVEQLLQPNAPALGFGPTPFVDIDGIYASDPIDTPERAREAAERVIRQSRTRRPEMLALPELDYEAYVRHARQVLRNDPDPEMRTFAQGEIERLTGRPAPSSGYLRNALSVPLVLLHVERQRSWDPIQQRDYYLSPGTGLLKIEAVLYAANEDRALDDLLAMMPHAQLLSRKP